MIIEKIREVADKISNSEDLDCIEVLEDLILSAGEFVKKVNTLEGGIIVSKYYKDGEEFREYMAELDKEKFLAHNELIANVKIVNRLCKKYNIPIVYIGDEEDRAAIGKFGLALTNEIFSSRRT
ncbi:DUF3232 domain-containing protein [Clostridium sp. MSJ-11]|uniref:DUF3232 domain-containing protein n=1 Tax=Clostridium mobile TaxID=2841512 RepID=A0ABS6EEK3_9CLOT|nr:DUF3232 domain-containing protein [Clostridium mobile]MBU5483582.1 DUF3232 domain-containing protein [Clostridium mobile]